MNRRGFVKQAALATGALMASRPAVASERAAAPPFDPRRLTPRPPLGWNSYDCYPGSGTAFGSANEWTLMENLDVFVRRLKPVGYEYFVVDCRWFAPTADGSLTRLDAYGRSLPSEIRYPRGFGPLVEKAHRHGVKFGVHLIRGIPKKAVELNLPVKDTPYRARDVRSATVEHRWDVMDSIDLGKPGGREYYASVLELLAEWGVDFLKYDEIERFPADIEAVADAVARCGRDIVLSLSPGDWADSKLMGLYRRANTLRISGDVWDRREDIDKTFRRWEEFQGYGGGGFWIDLDMIPFGHILLPYPQVRGAEPMEGLGYERMDAFTPAQKRTFMTQRALAASPLFMGGNLPTTDELSFELITHRGMLECNQNGVTGSLASRSGTLDVWRAPRKDEPGSGWLGVFNRSLAPVEISLRRLDLGFDAQRSRFRDVWADEPLKRGIEQTLAIAADGVAFLKYEPS